MRSYFQPETVSYINPYAPHPHPPPPVRSDLALRARNHSGQQSWRVALTTVLLYDRVSARACGRIQWRGVVKRLSIRLGRRARLRSGGRCSGRLPPEHPCDTAKSPGKWSTYIIFFTTTTLTSRVFVFTCTLPFFHYIVTETQKGTTV